MKKKGTEYSKAELDNHANQLNKKHKAYHQSRQKSLGIPETDTSQEEVSKSGKNLPSTTGQPSGKRRDNLPSKKKPKGN